MSRSWLLLLLLVTAGSPAAAYKLLGSAWDADQGPVYFHLEPAGSDDVHDGSDLEAVRSAFRRWSCVSGSRLRLLEGALPGAKEGESGDGINSVFWDEDGSYGLGIATLGVTLGPAPGDEGDVVERTWSTIVFNGVDHVWSTHDNLAPADQTVDVESIAVHEAGHWLGLGHSCEDAEETVCTSHDKAVMHPTYPGGRLRELGSDDEDGARTLYPQEDDSSCDGPFRQGEPCSCNDECVDGLLCVPTASGGGLCAPPCTSENVSCPNGFSCVLGADVSETADNEGAAHGLCRKLEGDGAPAGAVCQRDSECAVGLCARADAVGRTVCRVSCDDDEDCPLDHGCQEGACLSLAGGEGLPCAGDVDAAGCACNGAATSADAPVSWLFVAALFCVAFVRRARLRMRATHRGLNQATRARLGVAYKRLGGSAVGGGPPPGAASLRVRRSETLP